MLCSILVTYTMVIHGNIAYFFIVKSVDLVLSLTMYRPIGNNGVFLYVTLLFIMFYFIDMEF